jgi:hypothetical protein
MTTSLSKIDTYVEEHAIEQAESKIETPPSKWPRPVFVHVPLQRMIARPDLFSATLPDVDPSHVDDLVARIERKDSIDPPLIVKIGGQWVCVDGHHRIAAYRRIEPRQNIKCEWFDGTVREAADERLRHLRRNEANRLTIQQELSTTGPMDKIAVGGVRHDLLKAVRHPLLSIVRALSMQHGSNAPSSLDKVDELPEERVRHETDKADAQTQDCSAPSGSEIADELRYAPLANLRGRCESDEAKALVHHLAERYPRGTGKTKSAKAYRQVKTRIGFELAIAAFLGELLAAHGDEWRGGWIRCSLDKDAFKGREVTYRQFANVREAWVAAGLVNEVKGFPGWFEFGNPGPARGKMTRYKATPKLLAICAEYGITPDNVSNHFWIEFVLPSELVQLTSPSRQTPTNRRTIRLREEVAELNEFINQQVITPSTIRHIGWVRKFHMADRPGFKWNRGGRLYSQPPVGSANYQNRPESERLKIEINNEPVAEIDIGSSYLTIFYGWHDIQLDIKEDAYRGVLGPGELDREVAKFWVNASFGNSSLLSRWTKELVQEFEKKLAKKGLCSHGFDRTTYPMKVICEKVLKRHPLLERWGGEIRGRVRDWGDLMFAESEAVIRTMLTLKREHRVPSLPVYDAIIVPVSKRELAEKVLAEQFRVETGVLPRLDVNTWGFWDF